MNIGARHRSTAVALGLIAVAWIAATRLWAHAEVRDVFTLAIAAGATGVIGCIIAGGLGSRRRRFVRASLGAAAIGAILAAIIDPSIRLAVPGFYVPAAVLTIGAQFLPPARRFTTRRSSAVRALIVSLLVVAITGVIDTVVVATDIGLSEPWNLMIGVALAGANVTAGLALVGWIADRPTVRRAAGAVAQTGAIAALAAGVPWLPPDSRAGAVGLICAFALVAGFLWLRRWRRASLHDRVAGILAALAVTATLCGAALWTRQFLPADGAAAMLKLAVIGAACTGLVIGGRFLPPRTGYFLSRVVLGIVTVLAVAAVLFILLNLLPAKWYDYLLPEQATPEQQAIALHRLGVDQPLYVQFLSFLNTLLQLPPDLGYSKYLHQSVASAIGGRLGATALLMGTAYVVALLIAIPVGVISAIKQYSKLDTAVTGLAFIGVSLPNYWFGIILIYFFAVLPELNGHHLIFPPGGIHSSPLNDRFDLDVVWHMVLPVTVLVVQIVAGYVRYVRSSMLDVLGQDHVRTARAKGLSTATVVLRHAFRNSLLPLITLIGVDLPGLFVGAVVTEVVFNWPGMGQLFDQEVIVNDIPTLTGLLVILGGLVVAGNLIADLCYTLADPRISYARRARG